MNMERAEATKMAELYHRFVLRTVPRIGFRVNRDF